MPRYITSETEMGIQWNDFKSNVGMLLYYVAVADTDRASLDECKRYVRKHYFLSILPFEKENNNRFILNQTKYLKTCPSILFR